MKLNLFNARCHTTQSRLSSRLKYTVIRLKYTVIRLKYTVIKLKYTVIKLKYTFIRLKYTVIKLKYTKLYHWCTLGLHTRERKTEEQYLEARKWK
jgi:hypothetical protein